MKTKQQFVKMCCQLLFLASTANNRQQVAYVCILAVACCPSFNICFATLRDAISPLSGGILMKLDSSDHL